MSLHSHSVRFACQHAHSRITSFSGRSRKTCRPRTFSLRVRAPLLSSRAPHAHLRSRHGWRHLRSRWCARSHKPRVILLSPLQVATSMNKQLAVPSRSPSPPHRSKFRISSTAVRCRLSRPTAQPGRWTRRARLCRRQAVCLLFKSLVTCSDAVHRRDPLALARQVRLVRHSIGAPPL